MKLFEITLYFSPPASISNRNFIAIDEVKRFIVDCFVAVKTPHDHAQMMADLLVGADYRGHFSHGLNRLEFYLNDIRTGALCAEAKPKILKVSFMNSSPIITNECYSVQKIFKINIGITIHRLG